MSRPPRSTRPLSGVSNPAMIASVVLLPLPEGPSTVKNSPCATLTDSERTAGAAPNHLLTSSTTTVPAELIGVR